VRIKATNSKGKRVAKGCRAYLTSVIDLNNNNAELLPGDARQLAWMHDQPREFKTRQLVAEVPNWIDVVYTEQHAAPRIKASCYPPFEMPLGRYLLTVLVVSKNGENAIAKVRVECNPTNWTTLRGELE
jgi:hypothetical protein